MPNINLEAFDLPFFDPLRRDIEESTDDSTELDEQLEMYETGLPDSSVFIGSIEGEVDNWTTWKVDDRYFVVPSPDNAFDWALFRISWDDNWGRYDLSADARCNGMSDAGEAGRLMAKALFDDWGYDLESEEYSEYASLVNALG